MFDEKTTGISFAASAIACLPSASKPVVRRLKRAETMAVMRFNNRPERLSENILGTDNPLMRMDRLTNVDLYDLMNMTSANDLNQIANLNFA